MSQKKYPKYVLSILFFYLYFLPFSLFSQIQYIVSDIKIEGNKRTRPEIILREMTFQIGDSVLNSDSLLLLQRNQQNIYNLRLFNVVNCEWKKDTISRSESYGKLIFFITLKERWYIFPVPILLIEERNSYDFLEKVRKNAQLPFKEWEIPRVSANVSLVWRNITGRNNTLYFMGQAGFSSRLQSEYFHPWAFPKQKIDFFAGITFRQQKQIIYTTNKGKPLWGNLADKQLHNTYRIYTGIRKRYTPFKSLYLQLSYNYHVFNDSIYVLNPTFLHSQNSVEHYPSLSVIYSNDRRDVKTFPLSGFRYRLLGRVVGYLPGSTSSFTKLGYSVAHYVPISKRWFWAYGSQSMITFGKNIPFYEKSCVWIDKDEFPEFYNDLRGYERYAIDGTFINLNKAEIKYAIIPRKIYHAGFIPFKKFQDFPMGVYWVGFAENGNIWDRSLSNQDQFLKKKALYGYGTGLHLISFYDFLVRMEVSFNHLNEWMFNFHAVIPIK